MVWQTVSNSPAETRTFGCRLGSLLRRGDVLFLAGELGAGKTHLAQGIAAGLGATGVRSPSFTLLHRYQAGVPVHHADLYRLASREEAADLDLAETSEDGVLLVEWPALAAADFPEHLLLTLDFAEAGEDVRRITVSPVGTRYEDLARELRRLVDAGV